MYYNRNLRALETFGIYNLTEKNLTMHIFDFDYFWYNVFGNLTNLIVHCAYKKREFVYSNQLLDPVISSNYI